MVVLQAAVVSLLIPPARRRRMSLVAWRNADLLIGVALVEAAIALVPGDTFYDGPALLRFGSTGYGVHLFDLVALWPLLAGIRRLRSWRASRAESEDASVVGTVPVTPP